MRPIIGCQISAKMALRARVEMAPMYVPQRKLAYGFQSGAPLGAQSVTEVIKVLRIQIEKIVVGAE